jgi:hypothetical protein
MVRHGRRRGLCDQVRASARRLVEGDGAGLRELLPPERVAAAVQAEGVKFIDCLYTPLVTLWTFLAQVLGPDRSCAAAVAKLLALLGARGGGADEQDLCDPDTGPYCKARKRLPESLLARLARESGAELHRKRPAAAGELPGGRPVKVADGTTLSMPDTPENQAAYPQQARQKAGLGFPVMRLVAVLSLGCAAVLGVAVGPYKGKRTGETALLRTLLDAPGGEQVLSAGDVLLADRYYASYWMVALLLGRGVDSVLRQHQLRKTDFRTGTRLGRGDHRITWAKPARPPEWMDEATYLALPGELTVREVRVRVAVKGFRVRSLVLATTLLDAGLYSADEIGRAYRCRWHAELDLRAIKQTMGMDVLRCKTPDMVRKEVWMHLLAYNLVRAVMAEAASKAGVEPRDLSFAGALQTLDAFAPALRLARTADLARLWGLVLRGVARRRVGNRPDRYEPRAVKRRPKPIALLTVPREQARRRLARSPAKKG